MRKKFVLIIFFIGIIFLAGLDQVSAFGISPPFVNNEYLIPGSHYEKTIYLSRGDAGEARVEVEIEAGDFQDWVSIKQGNEFILPEGQNLVPMTIVIDVPRDTELGIYQGYVRVSSFPTEATAGQIALVGGARVNMNLVVSENGHSDFKVRGVSIPPRIEQNKPLEAFIMIENTGNTKIRPSKVEVDIYELNHIAVVESGVLSETGWVEPFETSQIKGEMPIDLPLGEYWADVTVYKEGENTGTYKVYFMVVPEGSLEALQSGETAGEKRKPTLQIAIIAISIVIFLVVILVIWYKTNLLSDKIKNIIPKKKGKSTRKKNKAKKKSSDEDF